MRLEGASELRKRTIDEAAAWWVKLQSPQVSRVDREAFVNWLRESPVHVTEMLRMGRTHGALEQFKAWEQIDLAGRLEDEVVVTLPGTPLPQAAQSMRQRSRARRAGSWWRTRRVVVAAVSAASVVSVLLFSGLFSATDDRSFVTGQGERLTITLSDGSVLQMDPQTRLRMRFDKNARSMTLERGRTLFRVAKDADRPFVVESQGMVVRALGTVFAVALEREVTRVTVSEGKVALLAAPPERMYAARRSALQHTDPAPVEQQAASAVEGGRAAIVLTANQQATVAGGAIVSPAHAIDSATELAWADGRLVFHNSTVAEVVAEFNRYNRVQLSVSDPAFGARRLSGVFVASDPDSFVEFLQTMTRVAVQRDAAQRVILTPEP